ncbi:MAG: O-antigen ligase domain-containing protein, partial [Oxalobacteraceae bacterium]
MLLQFDQRRRITGEWQRNKGFVCVQDRISVGCMRTHNRLVLPFRPSLPFALLVALLIVLWIAGGASRADALGQTVVRASTWLSVIVAILFSGRPSVGTARPVALILLAATVLVLLQLVPLPPDIWQSLPGRRILTEAAAASGQTQPWRPWSIVPAATLNALSSLIVPTAALIFVAGLKESERALLLPLILCLAAASTMVGLLQFSGVALDNPLINESPGQVSGNFANRNHFAVFLALGCLVAPIWATLNGRRPGWRGPAAFGLVLLFVLTILASGSRAGLILGLLALVLGPVIAQRGIRSALRKYPRWALPTLIAGVVSGIAILVLASVAANRAVSIDRLFWADEGQDMRSRGLPTVLAMIRSYFPAGSGLGGFDPIFRMHEPFSLLKPTYFNHAHNDLLEIVLDAGFPGLLLLIIALLWWLGASARAWQAGAGMQHALPKLGSAMLLLILVASAFDYPARTPIMMAIGIIAAIWLSSGKPHHGKHGFTNEVPAPIADASSRYS